MTEVQSEERVCTSSSFDDGFGKTNSSDSYCQDSELFAKSDDFLLPRKGMSITICVLFIVAEMAGSGILTLPRALRDTGWTGILILTTCCLIALYSGIRLGECWIIIRNRDVIYKTSIRDPYPAIGFESYGNPAKRLVEFCILITLFGVCVVFLLLSSQNITNLVDVDFGSVPESHKFRIWLLICCLSLLPLSYFATPKDIWPLALGASVFTASACVLIIYKSFVDRPSDLSTVNYNSVTVESFFSGLATMVFTFGGASLFPTFQTDMRKPKDFPKAAIAAFGIVLFIYIPTAAIPFLVFGDELDENVLVTLRKNKSYYGVTVIAESVLTAHLLFTYVITLNPIFQQVEEYLRIPKYFGWKRVLIRTSIVALVLGTAEAVQDFGPILELIGGTTVTMMGFVLPCIFYLKLKRDCPLYIKVFHAEIIVVATVAGCISTYSAIQDMRKVFK